MASVRKRGKKWQAEVRLKGNYRSKIFDTRIEADYWAAETTILLSRQTGQLITGKTMVMAY